MNNLKIQKTRGLNIWIVAAIILGIYASASPADGPKLVGAFFLKGKVGLKWQEMEGVSEFFVYRKSVNEDYRKIASTKKARYFDIDLTPGAAYTYKISIIASDGTEAFSNEKTVTIPESDLGEFLPPTWSGVRTERDKILLNWDNVPNAMAYNVYRSTTPGEGYEVVGNSQTSKFADKSDLVMGETYYYVISALNSDFDETEFSEEKNIKFGLSKEEMQRAQEEASKIVLEETKLTLLFEMKEAGSLGPMNQPSDIFVNSKGNIFVVGPLTAKVYCFDGDGKYLFSFGEKMDADEADDPLPGSFHTPFTLFIDKQDNVYVTDTGNHDIQVFTPDGKFIRRIKVDKGSGENEVRPNGIHVLDDGRIVITDTGNHRILILDKDGKILLAKGEGGPGPGQFIFPDELTVVDNTIFVVDVINARIQALDLNGNFIRAFGEIGQTAGTFARPKAITADEEGRIWVSDGMSHMIQCFTQEGEVKSAIGGGIDPSINIVTPRGIFFKNSRFYIVNRIPHTISVYKIG